MEGTAGAGAEDFAGAWEGAVEAGADTGDLFARASPKQTLAAKVKHNITNNDWNCIFNLRFWVYLGHVLDSQCSWPTQVRLMNLRESPLLSAPVRL
jgi:hypothetical protein